MLPSRPRAMPPPGWVALLEVFLGASPGLSQRLWQVYEPRCSLRTRYLLENVLSDSVGATPEALLEAITPQLLIRLCLKVSPEHTGHRRDPEIVRLEDLLLRCLRPERPTPWYEQCLRPV
jgi:hypothetical protein